MKIEFETSQGQNAWIKWLRDHGIDHFELIDRRISDDHWLKFALPSDPCVLLSGISIRIDIPDDIDEVWFRLKYL